MSVITKTDTTNLGYLGEDFQYKLVHAFIEDKEFFKDLYEITDQNMFTNPTLKMFVGIMKEYFEKESSVPSYDSIIIVLRDKIHNAIDLEVYLGELAKLRETSFDDIGLVKDLSTKFFRQQNIVKTANQILKIASNGVDEDKCTKYVELMSEAISKGVHNNYGVNVTDDLEDTLSMDYRNPIPTGIKVIDDVLEGGIGKGELGVIACPTGIGKVQPFDAKIITPSGIKQMCEIKVGDYVIGQDGKPTKVLAVFPHTNWDFYKVTFTDGVSCECGMEHLWSVKSKFQREKYEVLSLKEIVVKGIMKYSIPLTRPVEYLDKNVTIDPYLLGYIVGKNEHEFIPKDYLVNSIEKRIALLNGLLDSNGRCLEKGYVQFSSKSKQLVEDVRQLVLSLGGFASLTSQNIVNYTVTIHFEEDNQIPLFRLEEKQKQVRYSSNKGNIGRFFDKVEFSRKCDGQCILVDSESHLYLTDDYIVTHNTSLTTGVVSHVAIEENKKVLQIVFEDTEKQIRRKHLARFVTMYGGKNSDGTRYEVEARNLSKPEVINYVKDVLKAEGNKERYEKLRNNVKVIRLQSGEVTAEGIKRLIKKIISIGFIPDLCVIDYFECLNHDCFANVTNEFDKEGKSMRKFEAMAGELGIAFWIPSQGTKDSINLELLTIDKMSGSAKKSQIAHIILSIAKTTEDVANNKATLAILKNRAGQSGKVFEQVNFNNGTCIIEADNSTCDTSSLLSFSRKQENKVEAKIFKQALH